MDGKGAETVKRKGKWRKKKITKMESRTGKEDERKDETKGNGAEIKDTRDETKKYKREREQM